MLSKEDLERKLDNHPLVIPRLQTLKLAEEINPEFQNPHIIGGFLRNIALDIAPNDCDVVFQGKQLNQPGITEAVREAERRLGIAPYPEWDFENAMATGESEDFKENTIGTYSHHTDYITMLLLDIEGRLYIGEQKTLSDIEHRVYDLRFAGIEVLVNHRSKGKDYQSCIMADLTRGLYLCTALNLTPSSIATFLMSKYDYFFAQLDSENQKARTAYWLRKTKGNPKYQSLLDRFEIESLKTSDI